MHPPFGIFLMYIDKYILFVAQVISTVESYVYPSMERFFTVLVSASIPMISSFTSMKSFLIRLTPSPIYYIGISLVILISLYHIALHIYYLWLFSSCPICLEDYKFTDSVCILSCGHRYHRRCILKWLQCNPRCCICRHRVGPRSYSAIHARGY